MANPAAPQLASHAAGPDATGGDLVLDRALAGNVPYLDQWLGLWAIEPRRGQALYAALKGLNVGVHLQAKAVAGPQACGGGGRQQDEPAGPDTLDTIDFEEKPERRYAYGYRIINGVALLSLSGTLMKHEASATESTSTVMMRRSVRKLMTDAAAKAVIFQIDSPGGTVAGAYELAGDIAALAKVKPVHAHAANLVASAAYLQASQMRSISATPSTLVGSLGTYGAVYDYSAAAEREGIKVHLIKGNVKGKSPLMKGCGLPGVEISEEQLERLQEEMDDLNAQFIGAVLDGPRKPAKADVEEWFLDAGCWIAGKAKKMGLIDRVETLDEMLARVAKEAGGTAGSTAGNPATVPNNDTTAAGRSGGGKTQQSGPAGPTEKRMDPIDQPEAGQQTAAADKPAETKQQEPAAAAPEQPKAATVAELKAACPGATSDFLVAQSEKGATVAQAKDAYLVALQEQHAGALTAKDTAHKAAIDAKDAEIKALKEENEGLKQKLAAAPRGSEPVSHQPEEKPADPKAAKLQSTLGDNLAKVAGSIRFAQPAATSKKSK